MLSQKIEAGVPMMIHAHDKVNLRIIRIGVFGCIELPFS